MYPVAPGNSVTFINENEPYCYTKSVDLSQLDRPKFDKYRLVKEEDDATGQPQKEKSDAFVLREEFQSEVKRIEKMINEVMNASRNYESAE